MATLRLPVLLAGFLAFSLSGSPVIKNLDFKPAKCCGGACPVKKGKASPMPCCKITQSGNETAKAAEPVVLVYHAVSTAFSTSAPGSYFQPNKNKDRTLSAPLLAPTGLSPPLA